MNRCESTIAELQKFCPTDDGPDNIHRLQRIVDALPDPEIDDAVKRAVFDLIARWPSASLGMPGPLVHWLESVGTYHEQLRESLKRKPTFLSVWMVSRILNSLPYGESEPWLVTLREAFAHPEASANVKSQLENILGKYEDA